MKRMTKASMAALMLLSGWMMPNMAWAEEAAGGGGDVTLPVLILGTAAIVGAAYLWKREIRPFLEEHALLEAAEMTVQYVEAVFGRGHGEEKWAAALEKMAEHGWNLNRQEIQEALKAAWQILNVSQIAAGIKESGEGLKEEQEPFEGNSETMNTEA